MQEHAYSALREKKTPMVAMRKMKKGRVLQAVWKQLCEDTEKFIKYAEYEWDEYMKSWQQPEEPDDGITAAEIEVVAASRKQPPEPAPRDEEAGDEESAIPEALDGEEKPHGGKTEAVSLNNTPKAE